MTISYHISYQVVPPQLCLLIYFSWLSQHFFLVKSYFSWLNHHLFFVKSSFSYGVSNLGSSRKSIKKPSPALTADACGRPSLGTWQQTNHGNRTGWHNTRVTKRANKDGIITINVWYTYIYIIYYCIYIYYNNSNNNNINYYYQ